MASSSVFELEDADSRALVSADSAEAWKLRVLSAFWHGGSDFDAWLNICSSKVAQVLLTLPAAYAQMGLASGIAFQLLQGLLGWWSCCMMNMLYLQHRSNAQKTNPSCFENHTIQFYEILGGLLGPWWKAAALIVNMGVLFSSSAIQIIACGSIVSFLNGSLDKRTWTFIFGACFSLSILIPSAHNYRVFSFLGVIMLTYTAWYMTIASSIHGKASRVPHTGPHDYASFFAAVSNLVAFGGHSVPVEIMDAMWRPRRFKVIYLYAILYIFSIAVPSSISVYLVYGDKLFANSNAFALLPRSDFRDTAVILMLFHQFYQFGILSLPIYLAWEKLFGIHESGRYAAKIIARIPVFLALWLTALMFPFFGAINSFAGAFFLSLGTYIMPCAATIATYWSSSSRSNAFEQPPFRMNWISIFCVSLGVVLWMSVVATGLGAWASIVNLRKQAHGFGLFAKCYQCRRH